MIFRIHKHGVLTNTPASKMVTVKIFFILATTLSYSNSEYIPPGPAYPCPKDANKELLHPCVCENGTDVGLYMRCENTGLAVLSVGLGNLASLELPVEKLVLKNCKITRLFGSMFHRSVIRIIEIIDTPIKTIDQYAFAGVNKTLQELYMMNTKIVEFPKEAFMNLGNLSVLSIDGHRMTKLDKDVFAGSLASDKLIRLQLSNGLLSDIPVEIFPGLRKLKYLDFHANRLATLKKNQFRGLRDLEVLDVSYNNITKLDGSHLGDLTKMGWCNASHNLIADIPRGMFARNTILKVVHLDNNRIKKLDSNTFRGMRLMRRLYLQDNIISDVGRGTFTSLASIGTIDLARNLITKVDYQMFQEVKYAEIINLAENNITLIDKQAFTDLYQAAVNISHNQLASIEEGAFQNCNNLTVLDLSYNQLKGINPKAFDENTYPFELRLEYNQLTNFGQIPLHNMTGIRILNASYNAIEAIPKNAFPKLYELHTVDLSHNNLSDIFSSVFQNLFSFRYLNLSYNSLEQIKSTTFGTIPTILELDLSHNRLRDVSKSSLFKLASCRVLDLSYNQLDKIFQIPISLGELNFAHNNLTSVPANTWPTMNALLRLNLSANSLSDGLSSDSFAGLLTLQTLDLSSNGLTLPPWQALSPLTSLQYLYMQGNNLTSLSKSAFGNQPTLFVLDLSRNQLGAVAPLAFSGLQQLLQLSLSGNQLWYIPNGAFKTLVALRKLDLSHNYLDKIDNKTHGLLDDCLSLEMVDLSHNKFGFLTKKMFPYNKWIPYRLFEVDLSYNEIPVVTLDLTVGTKKMKKLNLSHNVLNDIRNDVLGNLTSLQVLDLSNNKLKNLISMTTDAKFNLPPNITHLYLNNNSLHELPVSHIAKAPLQVLDVRGNRIATFYPELVKKMKTGLEVYFEDNPLTCDCFVRPLKHLLNHIPPDTLRMDRNRYNFTCIEPLPLQNENLLTIDEDRLLCAGNIATEEKLNASNTDTETSFDFVAEPDLVFREVQFSQQTIDLKWYVLSNEDVADFFVFIRDDNNKVYYSADIAYNLRAHSAPIDKELQTSLRAGGRFDVCVQAKSSNDLSRKRYETQCRSLPPNFDRWDKTISNDIRSIIRRTIGSSFARKSAIRFISDSMLLFLCIFLGVFCRILRVPDTL